jgi:hypothetical protein
MSPYKGKAAADNGSATALPLTGGPPQHEGMNEPNPFALATSSVGLYMTEDHRYWVNGEGPFPSVTTVLDVLHKQPLVEWFKYQIALSAMLHLPELIGKSVEDGIAYLLTFPDAIRDRAGNLGTQVHSLANMQGLAPQGSETAAEGFGVPDEAFPYLEAFRGFLGFLEAQGGRIISSEHAVYNKLEGYCGTYDLIISFRGETWLLDIKSGKGYYPDFGLQLAGYAHAEYIVLPNDPTLYPMPLIDRTAVLHLRPDAYPGPMQYGWRLVEYPTTDRDYYAFLAALELWKWKAEGRFTQSSLNKAAIHEDPKTQVPDA